jgi:hypothetical protein
MPFIQLLVTRMLALGQQQASFFGPYPDMASVDVEIVSDPMQLPGARTHWMRSSTSNIRWCLGKRDHCWGAARGLSDVFGQFLF